MVLLPYLFKIQNPFTVSRCMMVSFLASQACAVCLYAQHQSVYLCKSLRLAGAALARRNQFCLTIHSLLSCAEPNSSGYSVFEI